MDPPRQVSRRGPGSGPVFRTVKKQPNSAFSPQHYSSTARSLHTQPIPSFPITIPDRNVPKAETADNLRARPIALKDIASTTLPIEVKLHKLTSDIEDDKNEADTTRIHTRSKPVKKPSHPEIISGPRTRCRSHKLDEAAPWASVSVSVAIAASATLQRNISPETMKKSRDRSRKNKLSHARKLNENNRRQCVAPDKVLETDTMLRPLQ